MRPAAVAITPAFTRMMSVVCKAPLRASVTVFFVVLYVAELTVGGVPGPKTEYPVDRAADVAVTVCEKLITAADWPGAAAIVATGPAIVPAASAAVSCAAVTAEVPPIAWILATPVAPLCAVNHAEVSDERPLAPAPNAGALD